MPSDCCGVDQKFDGASKPYIRVLWIVIFINASMFVVEMGAGFFAGSQSLKADSLDFLADTTTYLVSLYVIGGSIQLRTNAAMFKGVMMALVGLWVLFSTCLQILTAGVPIATVMGAIGMLALFANITSAVLLFKFRDGDANVRSIWLCSRNDAIGNLAVVIAASGVWATHSIWPDLIVAILMASLFLYGSFQIIRQALTEKREALA